uniref:Uncharacterized protein n=1 Tax=Opuntia streptacantha TaxID=393608 RepID=A0A7C9EVW7_OPUST
MRPPAQRYYHQVQQVPSDPVYRELPVYTMGAGVATLSGPPAPAKGAAYSEGIGLPVRPVSGSPETTGRQVYYAAPGGVGVGTTSFQGVPVRAAGGLAGVGGKIVTKISPTSAAL